MRHQGDGLSGISMTLIPIYHPQIIAGQQSCYSIIEREHSTICFSGGTSKPARGPHSCKLEWSCTYPQRSDGFTILTHIQIRHDHKRMLLRHKFLNSIPIVLALRWYGHVSSHFAPREIDAQRILLGDGNVIAESYERMNDTPNGQKYIPGFNQIEDLRI